MPYSKRGENLKRFLNHRAFALGQLLGGDLLSKALLIAANILLIRAMPAHEFALFTTMFALMQFSYQAVCGIVERLYIAEHEMFRGAESRTMSLLLFGASLLIVGYFALQAEWLAAALSVAGSYTFSFFQLTRIRLQKQEQYKGYVAMDVARNVMTLSLLFILIVIIQPQTHQAFLVIAIFALGAGLADVVGRRFTDCIRPTNNGKPAWHILLSRKALIAYAIVGAIFPYAPIVLADRMSDDNVVASYGVAQRYQAIVSMLVVATNVYMLPRIANMASETDAAREAAELLKGTLILMPIIVLYVAVIWVAMPLLNGAHYDNARPIFLLLAGSGMFSLLATSMVNLILRKEQYLYMLGCISVGLVITVVASVALLSSQGAIAFAIGALLGYAFTNICFLVRGARILRRGHPPHYI